MISKKIRTGRGGEMHTNRRRSSIFLFPLHFFQQPELLLFFASRARTSAPLSLARLLPLLWPAPSLLISAAPCQWIVGDRGGQRLQGVERTVASGALLWDLLHSFRSLLLITLKSFSLECQNTTLHREPKKITTRGYQPQI